MAERVLFVHAHPDDETISTGATIATLVERGAEVSVLTCTRGERGAVVAADLQHLLASPTALGEYREGELAAALAALGVHDHRMLGDAGARWEGLAPRRYLDSGRGEPGELSLAAADRAEVAADIAAVLVALRPDVVVSCDVDGGDGHPDHVRVHEATRIAADVIGVPFYVVREGRAAASLTVDAAPVAERKRAALAAYRTQLTVDADVFTPHGSVARPIAAAERFSRFRPPASEFADQSLASRISSSVLALVLGAFAGATLTVAHQSSVLVAGFSVPWGIIAAILVTAGLIVGLRLVFESQVVAACAAAGLIASSAALALQSMGGSELIAATPAGYTWTFAPVAIAVVALGWPARGLRRRRRTA